MLDGDAVSHMLGCKETFAARKFLKHFRQSFVKIKLPAQLLELLIGGPIYPELVEQYLHVSQLVIVTVIAHQFGATPPKNLAINAKRREHDFVLHVAWTQGLIVIVDDGDGILRGAHSLWIGSVKPC